MQCKDTKQKSFKPTKVLKIFTSERLTSYSVLTVVWDYINGLKLFSKLDKLFSTAVGSSIQTFNIQIFMSVVLANLSGIHRLCHIEKFTKDPLVRKLLCREKGIDEDSFKGRLASLGQRGAFKLQETLLVFTRQWIKKCRLSRITIDCDSTEFTVHGHQEGAAKGYNPKNKGKRSYHPLLCFLSEMKLIVNSWFRTGSAYTSNGIVEFMKQTLSGLPSQIKTVFFRADSGFFNGELFDLLESYRHEYLVKAKLTAGIKKVLSEQSWNIMDKNTAFCAFEYQAQGWKKSRKMYAIRWVKEWISVDEPIFGTATQVPVYEYFCYCTNLKGLTVLQIHHLYGARAESENWIEHTKNQLLASKTICDDFWVNDMLWQLGVLAYNISVLMRYESDYKAWKQEPKTFRDWFILVPGKVIVSSRKTFVKMSKFYIYADRWQRLTEKIPLAA